MITDVEKGKGEREKGKGKREKVKTAKPSKINVMVKSRPAGEIGATSVNPTVVKVIPA